MHAHVKELIKRVVMTGWINFKRNSYVSVGTTGVMVLVLLLFSGLLTLNFLTDKIVTELENKVDITVYFKNDTSEDQIMAVKSEVEKEPLIKEVTYISKDQAIEEFKKRHAGDPLIQESLELLEINPLQATLNIKASDSQKYSEIAELLEGNRLRTLIDKINYYENEQVITRVQSISSGIRNWGMIITILLVLIAVLVTFNTIRLTIYNQRQEIEIMKLVGGSNWHVRAPLLIEGGLYGILAGVITLILFFPTTYFLSPKISVLIPGVNIFSYFISNIISFIFLVFLVGILIGVASSFIAIRRFLKI